MKSVIKKLWRETKVFKHPSLSISEKRISPLPNNQIPLPTINGFVLKNVADVLFVKAKGEHCEFYFKDNTNLIVTKSLKVVNKVLITHGFFPVHSSCTIQLQYISRYMRAEGGYLIMCNNSIIPIDKSKKGAFVKLFNGFYKT